MKKIFAALAILFSSLSCLAQYNDAYKCYPANWWAGMKLNKIQLMLHGDAIGNADGYTITYPGIKVEKVTKAENVNYAFVDISIAPNTQPGIVKIIPKNFGATTYVQFEIKARRKNLGKEYAQGVTAKDFIYLIIPDRFSNGDESNDKFANMNDPQADRSNPFLRHGGDLKGVENHLDYLKDLGVTAIWMTPVVENNMHLTDEGGVKRSTYHGYAFTNHYKVDKRFGGNEAYKSMIDAAHQKGIKVMQDAVYNHVGNDHFFILDLPMKSWVHQWPQFTQTSYKEQPLVDPYAAEIDKKTTADGWFTPFMPDLNQSNPYVANFLIQHAIWTVEEFGIDGWRVDTYFYSDKDFLNNINTALVNEFPKITVIGENSMPLVTNSAYFTQNNISAPFKHNLMGTLDFPMAYAMLDGVKQNFGWNDGVSRLYQTLAQDGLYKDPMRNSIFLDNHDFDRMYSVIGEDINKYKTTITWLLTLRGIPQLYYGTEILMKNFKDPSDAEVRRDFPGGWNSDASNKFMAGNRNATENEAFNFVKTLANFRKTSSAIASGKLMQYVPKEGVYVYFRYDKNQTVMVISNTAKEEKKISFANYTERTNGFSKYMDVITNTSGAINDFTLGSYQTKVLVLEK
ncbi:MAG: glycoside hydrolase family 13 protein [Ferruginibacter sp.]